MGLGLSKVEIVILAVCLVVVVLALLPKTSDKIAIFDRRSKKHKTRH